MNLTTNDLHKELQSRIKEVEELKSFLLANVSHEFRTPLNAILGFSDLLIDDKNSKAEQDMFIDEIRNGCRSMIALVDNFLEAARLNDDKEKLLLRSCKLHDIFNEACYSFNKVLVNSNKSIDFIKKESIGMHIGFVMADKEKLKRVLEILLNNALKFTDSGYIETGINVCNEHTIEFYVEDSGNGIPLEKNKELFDLFVQADPGINRKYNGLGLGLGIAEKLVHVMGGRIHAHDSKNKGTRFSFTIPYRNSNENAKETKNLPLNHNKSARLSKRKMVFENNLVLNKLQA